LLANKEGEHLGLKSMPMVKAYLGKSMIDMLIRRPQPEEHDSVRAVVQTVVDEIYVSFAGSSERGTKTCSPFSRFLRVKAPDFTSFSPTIRI